MKSTHKGTTDLGQRYLRDPYIPHELAWLLRYSKGAPLRGSERELSQLWYQDCRSPSLWRSNSPPRSVLLGSSETSSFLIVLSEADLLTVVLLQLLFVCAAFICCF